MPTIDCENVRQEVTKCLEQTQAFKNGLSVKEILSLPELEFPSECQDVKKAFDDCLRSAAEGKSSTE